MQSFFDFVFEVVNVKKMDYEIFAAIKDFVVIIPLSVIKGIPSNSASHFSFVIIFYRG